MSAWDEVPAVPKRKPGSKPAPKPTPKKAAPKPQKTIVKDTPDDELLGIIKREIKARNTDGKGAHWEDVIKATKHRGEEVVEEAINYLMDKGDVYEPVLGRLLFTDPATNAPTPKPTKAPSEPLQPPTPVAPPAHVPSATATPSKSKETPSMDDTELHAKFGKAEKREGYIGKIREQFIMVLMGNPYVTYAGLLDAAHAEGLIGIETTIVQYPNKENAETTIVKAAAHFLNKDSDNNTVTRTFTGIGDANPKNVKSMMVPVAIRLAETRAKSRALRDAINVGVAAVEEMMEEDKR